MKNIMVGDLVRILNEWAVQNPWMKGHFGQPQVGLVIKDFGEIPQCVVLIAGEEKVIRKSSLEVLCK
tara:strand:+ start:311 stop:511 length:201 start_codon:yes stop_codon:yes gene_type:complete